MGLGGISESITVELKGSAKSLIDAAKKGESAVKSSSNKMKMSFNAIKTAVKGVTIAIAAVGAGVTGFATLALAKSAQVEKAFASLSGLFKEGKDKLVGFNIAIDKYAMSLGINAVKVTEAFYQAVSAGFRDLEDASGVVEAAGKAAIAGTTELPTSVEAITRVLNAYGMAGKDANKVSDLLFQTVNYGVTTFAELAPVIGEVAGTAAQAKVPVEDLFATIAVVTQLKKTPEAITGIKNAIMSIISPTDEAKKAAKRFDIELSMAAIQAKGLVGVLTELKDLSPEVIAQLFPEKRAFTTVLAALAEDGEVLKSTLKVMKEEYAATENALGKMEDTLARKWERMWNTINEGTRRFGDIFREDVKDALDWLLEKGTPIMEEWLETIKTSYETIKDKYGTGPAEIVTGMVEEMSNALTSDKAKKTMGEGWTKFKDAAIVIAKPIMKDLGAALAELALLAFWNFWKSTSGLGWLIDFIKENPPNFEGDFPSKEHQHGGLVEGAYNSPQPIVAHAGEMVINPQATAANYQLLDAINRGETVYHDVSSNHFHFGDKFDRAMVYDKILPELEGAKRRGYGLTDMDW